MICEYNHQCGTCTSDGASCQGYNFISKVQNYKKVISPALSKLRWLEPIRLERDSSEGLDSQL